ncbi:transglutaminase domain-containing protein [Maridesulfovibrio sp.]|uniref:transglutaminase domain-containing protein n=1 Tax=Maridesulfovibrio sp. TaxID=2795000 RepID=UPI002A18A9BE|nr:transglutaminase domain-containing protein [Maridesulfovibrio sp.]
MIFKKFICLFLLAASISISGCSSLLVPVQISPYTNRVDEILKTSGSNRPQLEKFLTGFDSPEKKQAAQFIAANLPPCDRAGLSSGLLTDNLEYAFLARATTPWGKDVPWSDFLHYVLPHRVSQEKAVEWRKPFYTELLPVVSKCNSMEEAVLAVNRWCFSKTGFKSTQRWDQNPLMTINRGWGRCEEAVILTVCALRSVGIPARQAMVPAWQHSNDNHTWTEVKIGGKWHYIESANPDYGLDHAWFSGSARKAPLVISYAYGQLTNPEEPILKRTFGCTLLNTTARYAPVSRTTIAVRDNSGKPVPETAVFFSVFNYGSFSPVAVKTTDAEGKTDILLGPGSVLVSAAQGNASAYTGSTWIPGEQKKRDNILLSLTPENKPEGNILFRFDYNDSQAASAPPVNSEGAKKATEDTLKKSRLDRLQGMKDAASRFNPDLGPQIALAGLNVPQILLALNTCPTQFLPELKAEIKALAPADLICATGSELVSNTVLAVQSRAEAEDAGLNYNDKIFNEYVLNPRIMYEQMRPWRSVLHTEFNFDKGKKIAHILAEIGKTAKNLDSSPRGPLGSSLSPLGVYESGTASNNSEICLFATAAMRAAGIPARYLDEQGWTEYFDGKDWQPFYPQSPELTGNRNATDESRSYYSPWQTIKFRLPGYGKEDKHARYFRDFTVSRLYGRKFFRILEKTINGQLDEKNNIWEISVPTGENYLISARRNNKNEPNISVIKIIQAPIGTLNRQNTTRK